MTIKLSLILLLCSVDVLFGLRCSTSFPPRCEMNSTCEYGVEICEKSSEGSVRRGGVYCTTLVNSLSEMLIEQMGCMYDQETSKTCLNQSQCRMKFTNQQQTFLHCCCNQDFCNRNLNLSDPVFSLSWKNSSTMDVDQGRLCLSSFCLDRLSSVLLVVLIIVVVVVVSFFIVLCLFLRRRRSSKSLFKWFCQSLETKKKRRSIPSNDKEEEEEDEECSMLKKSEEKTIDVSRLSFEKSSLIGQGRCSEIYSGRYGEEKVAIKMFDQSRRNESNHLLFEREKWIYSLPLFDHLNLLQFFGSVTIDQSECLILQFARRGSLKEFLREHQINDEEQLIHFSAQIANGLEYLHQDCSTSIGKRRRGRFPIAHRDLKSENILLDENGDRLFLADFSMSIEINREDFSSSNHQQVGTPRYMSPEILAGTIGNEWNALLKCDIYALAIVFWEIISRLKTIDSNVLYQMPFEEQLLERNRNRNPSVGEMLQIVHLATPWNRPLMKSSWRTSSDKLNLFIQTIEQSWDQLPEARISSPLVAHRLRQL